MHVVMLSDHETLGGAAQAASHTAAVLCRRHRVTRCVLFPDGKRHAWRTWVLGREKSMGRLTRDLARRWLSGAFPAADARAEAHAALRRALRRLRPDIINLHNLHSGTCHGWSPEIASLCHDFAPVVWTLHDMWSFTGRCAFSYDCRQFERGCGVTCPTAHEYPMLPPEAIGPAWAQRHALYDRLHHFALATHSRWLADEAQRGLWNGHHVQVVPATLPLDVYRPVGRARARQALGLDTGGPVLLTAAHDLSERRKGGAILPQVWPLVTRRPLTLLTMGQGEVPGTGPDIRVVPCGWVEEARRRALLYNAADLVLHPAPVDNYPNVVMEALACGTPALGFAVGGVPELIVPDQTGWLAEEKTPEAFAKALSRVLPQAEDGVEIRHSCRHFALRRLSPRRHLQAYNSLFAMLRRLSLPV